MWKACPQDPAAQVVLIRKVTARSMCSRIAGSSSPLPQTIQMHVVDQVSRHGSRQHLATLQDRIMELETLLQQNTPAPQDIIITSQGDVSAQRGDGFASVPPPASISNSVLPSDSLNPTELSISKSSVTSQPDEDFGVSILSQHDYSEVQQAQ